MLAWEASALPLGDARSAKDYTLFAMDDFAQALHVHDACLMRAMHSLFHPGTLGFTDYERNKGCYVSL